MGRPTTMPDAWASLVDAAGGVALLADLLGVGTMTLYRWSHGGTIPGPSKIAIASVAKALRKPNPLEGIER